MFEKYFSIIFVLFLPYLGKGQNTFKLEIIDSNSKRPISDASIFNRNSNKYYFSDENGFVSIENLKTTDTLNINHISFEATIKYNITRSYELVQLRPKVIELGELKVTFKSEKEIIEKAIEFLPLNYDIRPFEQVLSIDHLAHSEGKIIKRFLGEIGVEMSIFSKQYQPEFFGINTALLKDYHKEINFAVGYNFSNINVENIINLSYLNSLNILINRNKYFFNFDENSINSSIWEINFKPKKADKNNFYEGKLYIDKLSNGILKVVIKNSPNFEIKSNWRVIGAGKDEKKKREGVHKLKNSKTEIVFNNDTGKFKLQYIKSESDYLFTQEYRQMPYEIITEIVVIPKPIELKDYLRINMYSYNDYLKKNKEKSNSSFVSRKIEKKLAELKKKYPDMELD